jgi:hypothetical protein
MKARPLAAIKIFRKTVVLVARAPLTRVRSVF